jgi:Domain of unknown function (DUF4328)
VSVQDLERRAKAVVAANALLIAALAGSFVVGLMRLGMLGEYAGESGPTRAEEHADHVRYALASAARLPLLAIAFILLLRWLHFAYAGLDSYAPGVRRFATGWAYGGWFVPVLNWWRPKQLVNDVWLGPPSILRAAWWGAWLLAATFNWLTAKPVDTTAHLQTQLELWSFGFTLVAAALTIGLVRAVTDGVRMRVEHPEAPAAPGRPPLTVGIAG